MEQILASLVEVFIAVWGLLIAVLGFVAPWTPLIAWLAYWLFAVNWTKMWPVMARGGWIGVFLLGLVMALVWGVVAPPTGGTHFILGLTVQNFTGKVVYVTSLFLMAMFCGFVQLSGSCGSWASFPDEPEADEHHHDDAHHAHAAAH